jgi:hypothetical protein
VGDAAHRLNVKVQTDRTSYAVRDKAQVTVTVTLPNQQPAAHAEIALAAVDRALLELMPNKSWNLLEGMLVPRAWGVATSTAQMEIIGRRHYGRKAVPAGGGGGRNPTRELLDTLLLWNPKIVLDEKGQAQITVPLNDALTSFEIVAIADASTGLFGTGKTTIQSTQDLQIISGRPAWPWQDDMISIMIHKPNVWSEVHGWSPKYFTDPFKKEIRSRLKDRVMFGADYPLFRYERLVQDWKDLGYTDDILERVFHRNAERLFGITEAT